MGIELERLLKMDEHHLHELFGTETDNESTGSAEYKYLQEHIPEYIKRLKSRGTTRRSLYEEYLRNRPQGYSYCSFCLYNELESLLVNREDEKYHIQMEGLAPELTPKHRNLRGKDYFNSKNIDKNDK